MTLFPEKEINAKCSDKKFAIVTVTRNGSLLRDMSEELRNDREVVVAAVKQDGRALKYASEELRNDKEVVMAAVSALPEWSLFNYNMFK